MKKPKEIEHENTTRVIVEVNSYGLPSKCRVDALRMIASALHRSYPDRFRMLLVDPRPDDALRMHPVDYDPYKGMHGEVTVHAPRFRKVVQRGAR